MRFMALVALTVGIGCSARRWRIHRQQQWDLCADVSEPDHSIAGCTALIEADQETMENLAIALNNRSSAYTRKGQSELAIADLDRALQLNPNFALALNNRGNIYLKQGRNDRAMADFDQAIVLDPQYRPRLQQSLLGPGDQRCTPRGSGRLQQIAAAPAQCGRGSRQPRPGEPAAQPTGPGDRRLRRSPGAEARDGELALRPRSGLLAQGNSADSARDIAAAKQIDPDIAGQSRGWGVAEP